MGRSAKTTSRLRTLAFGAASMSCLATGLAQPAHAEGWAPTATKAFLPAVLAPRANATAAVKAFQSNLIAASQSGVDVASDAPISVTVALKLRNEADLDRALKEITEPGGAQFGHYISSAEFLAAYAPSEAQIQAVVAHLKVAGFTDISVAPNRLLITANGNAAAVQTGFNTGLTHFSFQGHDVFANKSDARVPSALGGIVQSVLGLQTVSVAHTLHKATLISDVTRASATKTAASTSEVSHTPTDFAKLYNASSLATGSKTKVGIITWGTLTQVQTDLKSYTSKAGLPTTSVSVVKTGTSTYHSDANSDVEWNLDSQTIVGTSGGVSQLIFYTSPNTASDGQGGYSATLSDLTKALNRAVTDNSAKVINVSLGVDEASAHSSGSQSADNTIFKQAQAQGQTFSVAAGDHGVYEETGGEIDNASDYSVSEPATSPYVIAIGGTALYTSGATTYGSEVTWNEGLESGILWATGGGQSVYETAPSWQSSALSVSKRVLPDIAFDAAQASGAQIISHGSTYQVGGTSLASPIFVGLWARLESINSNGLGFPAASFYKYFPSNTSVLHDVTSGNNGYNGYGFTAKSGYDQVTGYGSFDAAKLSTLITSKSGFAR